MINEFAFFFPPAQTGGSLLTPANAIWLVAVLIAATLIFGSINRRRTKLTKTLRDYVDDNQPEPVEDE